MKQLNELAVKNFEFCDLHSIKLTVTWIPREYNSDADFFSKLGDCDDWKVSDEVFQHFEAKWGPFSIDLFANHKNKRSERFYSKFFVPETSGVDAFRFSWENEKAWAVPPFSLVPQFLAHFHAHGKEAVLVVPHWPSASFWPLFASQKYSGLVQGQELVKDAAKHITRISQNKFMLDNRNYPLQLCVFHLRRPEAPLCVSGSSCSRF